MEEVVDTKTGREFRFTGTQLAHESSRLSTAYPSLRRSRWSEIEIWRTPADQYVIIKTGYSVLVHTDRDCAGKFASPLEDLSVIAERLTDEVEYCPRCMRDVIDLRAEDVDVLYDENDLTSVIVSPTADDAVRACYVQGDGKRPPHLTRLAMRALNEASSRDSDIDIAYSIVDVD